MKAKYWRKSSYRQSDIRFGQLKGLSFALLMASILMMYFNQGTAIFLVGYICLDLFAVLYFSLRTWLIKGNIKRYRLELTKYSQKILNRHSVILFATILAAVLHIIFMISKILHEPEYEAESWIWFGLLVPLLFSDSVHLSGITAFGEKVYASGEYIIEYSAIDQITELKSMNATEGSLVLMSLYKDQKEIGYDKMLVDEYILFRQKVLRPD